MIAAQIDLSGLWSCLANQVVMLSRKSRSRHCSECTGGQPAILEALSDLLRDNEITWRQIQIHDGELSRAWCRISSIKIIRSPCVLYLQLSGASVRAGSDRDGVKIQSRYDH